VVLCACLEVLTVVLCACLEVLTVVLCACLEVLTVVLCAVCMCTVYVARPYQYMVSLTCCGTGEFSYHETQGTELKLHLKHILSRQYCTIYFNLDLELELNLELELGLGFGHVEDRISGESVTVSTS
jgi:hypothetical protein